MTDSLFDQIGVYIRWAYYQVGGGTGQCMEEFTIEGYEAVHRNVAKAGNGAHIYLPKEWREADVTAVRKSQLRTTAEAESGDEKVITLPEPFSSQDTAHHLTLGETTAGKSFSVGRRAMNWWLEGDSRTLIFCGGFGAYAGVVGFCNGTHITPDKQWLNDRDRPSIDPEGVTYFDFRDFPLDREEDREAKKEAVAAVFEEIGDEIDFSYGNMAQLSDEVLVVIDGGHLLLPQYAEWFADAFETWKDVDAGLWIVATRIEETLHLANSHLRGSIRDYLASIELFSQQPHMGGEAEEEWFDQWFDLTDSQKEFLVSKAVSAGERQDFTSGLVRSAGKDTWNQFVERATPIEYSILTYHNSDTKAFEEYLDEARGGHLDTSE